MIEHERIGDAPFVGALISACDCNNNCEGCFNQHIKEYPTKVKSSQLLISEVKLNIFNKGIILAGLEWGLQKEEAVDLACEAQRNGLLSILYSGDEGALVWGKDYFDYIKTGKYVESKKSANHIEYGVCLSTLNQHIYKRGVDY